MADQLDFQEIPYDDTKKGDKPKEHVVEFTDFPPDATEGLDDEDESQDQSAKEEGSKTVHSIFSLAYYQQYFDVDTFDVGSRILGSMIPNPKRNYLEHTIRPKPDLYGPFWVCATLTFCIGIAGNVADFFHKSGLDFVWRYDFHKVTLAATVIYCYWLIIPMMMWGVLRWRGSIAGYTLTELICIYGYSLAIFIPCSILWLIPVPWLQLLIAVVCSALSGATLLITLYPAVKNDTKQVMLIFLVITVALHTLLATGFVLYFFKYNATAHANSDISPASNSTLLDNQGVPNQPPGIQLNNPQPPNKQTEEPRKVPKSIKPSAQQPAGPQPVTINSPQNDPPQNVPQQAVQQQTVPPSPTQQAVPPSPTKPAVPPSPTKPAVPQQAVHPDSKQPKQQTVQ